MNLVKGVTRMREWKSIKNEEERNVNRLEIITLSFPPSLNSSNQNLNLKYKNKSLYELIYHTKRKNMHPKMPRNNYNKYSTTLADTWLAHNLAEEDQRR